MKPVAVIDIGSNSVRLVVYEGLFRAAAVLFNEKSLCGLGRDIAVTGFLPPDGVIEARDALRRFRVLCDLMQVERIFGLGTAAVRRAQNGAEFIHEAEAIIGAPIAVLSGGEEARLTALGVLSGNYHPSGLAGDLGGGSLELVEITPQGPGLGQSFELGGLALRDAADKSLRKAKKIVEAQLGGFAALSDFKGRDFYAIGGTFRAIARLHMARHRYPLNVLHGYTVQAASALEFCEELQKVDLATLPAIGEIAQERRPLLAYGALVLQEILKRGQLAQMVISTNGVREGLLYDALPHSERGIDPLVAFAGELDRLYTRGPGHGRELVAWCEAFHESLPAVLAGQAESAQRLRITAALAAELAWRASPDYRGEESARAIAYAALPAIGHHERAFLASALFARYEGLSEIVEPPLRALLEPKDLLAARLLGCVLRVGFNISAGQAGALPITPLVFENGRVILTLPPRFADLSNERLTGRLKHVAKLLGAKHVVQIG